MCALGGGIEERSHLWRRVIFRFDNKIIVRGSIRDAPGGGRAISGSLPIMSEAIVLDNVEIFIRLDPTLMTRISRRFHTAEPGDIIYRPQIPALSIFADYADIYEPVERIGMIDRLDLPKIEELSSNAKSILFVSIEKAESVEYEEETEESR